MRRCVGDMRCVRDDMRGCVGDMRCVRDMT